MTKPNPIEALSGNLAANLRYIRERRGLTQIRLAKSACPNAVDYKVCADAPDPNAQLLKARQSCCTIFARREILDTSSAVCQSCEDRNAM